MKLLKARSGEFPPKVVTLVHNSDNAALLSALSAAAKVALGNRELESELAERLARLYLDAQDQGFDHGHRHSELVLAAADHGHRDGMAVRQQGHPENPAYSGRGDGWGLR